MGMEKESLPFVLTQSPTWCSLPPSLRGRYSATANVARTLPLCSSFRVFLRYPRWWRVLIDSKETTKASKTHSWKPTAIWALRALEMMLSLGGVVPSSELVKREPTSSAGFDSLVCFYRKYTPSLFFLSFPLPKKKKREKERFYLLKTNNERDSSSLLLSCVTREASSKMWLNRRLYL